MKAKMIGLKKAGMTMATLALTAGLFIGAKVTAFAADGNETPATATVVNANELVNGQTHDSNADDVDFYRIDIPEAGYVSLEFNRTNDVSPLSREVKLIAPDDTVLIRSTDYNFTSEEYGVGAGTYYVRVGVFQGANMSYSFKLNFTPSSDWESEKNDTSETANTVALGQTMNGILHENGDVDYYKVTVTEPGYLTMDFSHDYVESPYNWTVELLTENNKLLYVTKPFGTYTTKETSPRCGVAPGTYYVKVTAHWIWGANYTFHVNFTASDAFEAEGNDSQNAANAIALNKAYTAIINAANDHDYYKVEVPQPGTLTVDFSNQHEVSNSGWYVELYAANNESRNLYYKFIELSNTGNVVSDPIEVEAGTYYVHVNGASALGYEYTLKVNYDSPTAQLCAFVTRMYEVVLGRTPDAPGLNDWVGKLSSGEANAVDIVFGFVNSDEYKNQAKSNGEIVNDCYHAMLGRDADEGGYNDWVGRLDNGMSVNAILAGFVGSEEFGNLCNTYGIQPGSYTCGEARDQNLGVTSYVARLYTQALGRDFDADGLNDWCGRIIADPSRENIIQVAAVGFFHSEEFENKGLTNEEYVKVLYHTFLGRDWDDEGLADWVGQLDRGEKTRDEILPGFANSQEFTNIMAQYGL